MVMVRGPPGKEMTAVLEAMGCKVGSVAEAAGAGQGAGVVETSAFSSIAARTLAFSFWCSVTSRLHASICAAIWAVSPSRVSAYSWNSAIWDLHLATFPWSELTCRSSFLEGD